MDVWRPHRGHLATLNIADPALGMEHEDLDAITPCYRINRRASRIPASCAHDSQIAVFALKKLLEQQPQQLQRNIFESQRRPMEQFEQIILMIELDQRRHCAMGETAIGSLAEGEQTLWCKAVAHERLHNARRQFGIAQPAHCSDLFMRELRPLAGHIKPAIAGQPSQCHTGKIERLSATPSRNIFHGGEAISGATQARQAILALQHATPSLSRRYKLPAVAQR